MANLAVESQKSNRVEPSVGGCEKSNKIVNWDEGYNKVFIGNSEIGRIMRNG